MDEKVRPKSLLEPVPDSLRRSNVSPSAGADTQTLVIPLWPRWGYHCQAGSPALAEERREVFESVLNGLRTRPDDSDTRAACRFLLRHLAASAPDR